ncbi:primase-helicase family protein [Eudoraea adriatica]|uniref:primase-helicase family protein n=1 Tax=Eudoraea adriatica TaxID=446681 RepID=UPI00035CF218|nr:primase-helicase family protein [Eudoraea adriatica]
MFYKKNEDGKIEILHFKLIEFLAKSGYGKLKVGSSVHILVKLIDNVITEVSESELVNCVKDYLISINEPEVLEKYTKGLGGYLNGRKYDLLPQIKGFSDKEDPNKAWLYYKNQAVRITPKEIKAIDYKNITHPVWSKRFLNRDYSKPVDSNGHFRDFIYKLSKQDTKRFRALQTAIGYLLHRHNNPNLCKAVILIDEKIAFDGTANGGTGKSLIAKALSHCRDLVFVEGKNLKTGSWFKNQRIQITTDIVCYDDVGRDFSLEELYSMTTSGVVIEKKRRDEIHLSPEEAPKFMISSNYIVKGTGGPSDLRRRYEFELANFFSEKHQPLDEYGDLFFTGWGEEQWNKFDLFMMECLQLFLRKGLIEAEPLNLKQNRLINSTNPEFEVFSKKHFVLNKWLDKPILVQKFNKEFPHLRGVSSHQFTKWTKELCRQQGLDYADKSSGAKYLFYLSKRKEVKNGN